VNDERCPVCNSRLKAPEHATDPATGTHPINCPRCGPLNLASTLNHHLSKKPLGWAIVSHAIRRQSDQDHPFTVTQAWLRSVIDHETLPRPQEQADAMISILGEKGVAPSRWIRCYPQALVGLLGTDDSPSDGEGGMAAVTYVLDRLKAKNLIEPETSLPANDGTMGYRLTFDGWERFDDLRHGKIDSRVAFMAMKFGNEDLDRAFVAFVGAVCQTGFELRRLDKKPKAGLIDLHMRVEIRAAKFLVAELTDENRGAYWEAGFAEGLGKKVYYTCEASKFVSVKSHSDTEHMLTVKWECFRVARKQFVPDYGRASGVNHLQGAAYCVVPGLPKCGIRHPPRSAPPSAHRTTERQGRNAPGRRVRRLNRGTESRSGDGAGTRAVSERNESHVSA